MAGMAGDEHELPFANRLRAPGEEVLHLRRLAILVGTEQAHVEVEAGELEVVGIAAEERDLAFGGEDEADVGVLLRPVEVVRAALEERDDVAPQAGLLERLLLDRCHRLAAGGEGVVGRHP